MWNILHFIFITVYEVLLYALAWSFTHQVYEWDFLKKIFIEI